MEMHYPMYSIKIHGLLNYSSPNIIFNNNYMKSQKRKKKKGITITRELQLQNHNQNRTWPMFVNCRNFYAINAFLF